MTPENTIKVTIPTAQLKSILADNPEVIVAIEAQAHEKIAEELFRKIVQRGSSVSADLERKIDALLKDKLREFSSRFTLPQEARDAIKETAETAVRNELQERRDGFDERAMSGIVAKVERQSLDRIENTIKKLARAEFFDVLEKARASTASIPATQETA